MIEKEKLEDLALGLYQANCIYFGDFTLSGGDKSVIYFDLRMLRSNLPIKKFVIDLYAEMIMKVDNQFDLLSDVPNAATFLVSPLADKLQIPQISPRQKAKDHGRNNRIDGDFRPWDIVALIEDTTTTGQSIINSGKILREHNLVVNDVFALIERPMGARESLKDNEYNLHAVCTESNLLELYLKHNLIPEEIKSKIMG
ncbi:MAG: hypothetical protein Q7R43_05180 [Candidatus Daviesbacteria bacterium]|nr:hypothetical protein [Candidatus Daviesbacteria bacterium]